MRKTSASIPTHSHFLLRSYANLGSGFKVLVYVVFLTMQLPELLIPATAFLLPAHYLGLYEGSNLLRYI